MTPWATSCAGVPATYFQAVLCSDQAGAGFLWQTCPMHLYNSQYHAVKLSMYVHGIFSQMTYTIIKQAGNLIILQGLKIFLFFHILYIVSFH